MAGPFLTRDYTHFVQLEATPNTSPGAVAATDAFKSQTEMPFKRSLARADRDKDKDANQASVITTQIGREKSTWSVNGSVIPSGNAVTPTPPDMDPFYEAHFGTKQSGTAHTTTHAATPCTATVINLVAGGGAASGIPTTGGVLIAADLDSTNGIEVRRVVSRATDAVTVTPAFTAAPGLNRAIYTGVTYQLSEAQMKTVRIHEYLDGDNFRHVAGGCIPRNLEITIDGGQDTPETMVTVSGEGYPIATSATAMPTSTVAGQPHNPTEAKVFMGASSKLCLIDANLKSDNGVELRDSDFCNLQPNGVKRTGNEGRYNVELALKFLLTTTAISAFFDNAASLTSYDVMVQLGITPGKIVAISCPKWIPDSDISDQDAEAAIELSGRAYGTSGDDEVYLAFI